MKAIQAVLFDLDGTLADTAPDLGGALNKLLRQKGLPEKPLAAIRPHASHGSTALLAFGAGITPEHPDFSQWKQAYLDEYQQCLVQETVLFEGISEVLDQLHQRGLVWGIITNKPAQFTHPIVAKLNFHVPPAVVVSGDTCTQAKPSTLPMFYACQQIGVQPEHCLYIGDAQRDMQAGKDANMTTVLAQWGYLTDSDNTDEWPWDFSLKNPLDILHLLTHNNERQYHD